jgi:hypothetical protein
MRRKLESRRREMARRQFDRQRAEIRRCCRFHDERSRCGSERIQLERRRDDDAETSE